MRIVKRALQLAAATIGGLLYVWFAAVRYAPLARRRRKAKAARRRARRRPDDSG